MRKGQYGSSNQTMQAVYDPEGVRIAKIRNWNQDDYHHKYVVDSTGDLPAILLVLDANNSDAIVKTNIFANDQIIAQHDGNDSNDLYFYMHDRLGSIRQVIDIDADIATEVAKVLDEIVQGIGKTTDLVSEIAAASQEQSQGIDQVNTAMAQMDKVTQQNAANAEESASASEELSAQAEQMNDVVGELVAMVGGASQASSKSGTSRTVKKTRELSSSDHVYHSIANGSTKSAEPKVTANTQAAKAIPLDKKDDFTEFNS
ncbi:methyl-accepting chemotaxis protein [Planctomycetota bacterium]